MGRLRVHIFLSGLDYEFDQVRGEILRKDPKLDLENTYAYVRREYQQRQTMGSSRPISESSVMLANRTQQGTSGSSKNPRKSNNLKCSHYGEPVYVHIPKALRNKLDPCAKRCVFIGYSEFQKGYRCYDPQTLRLHVTLDASFHESEPYYSGGVATHPLQGESSSKENVLQEGGVEFFQLEEMNEQFGIPEIENEVSVPASIPLEVGPKSMSVPVSVSLEVGPESQVVLLEDRSESPMLAELPVI
ncbi:hypothetical protein GH714_033956 [Hevea brasiliensis]|uniref:Retroviral polymerase SH3-like domain-containing protein n=1 Tax=Hevea brasiliensis TaxID=3981 RepID=A0A6A6L2Z8_HEVBR|nr:hypothetical protein GH714_033956 [Hevea brasiliensis]